MAQVHIDSTLVQLMQRRSVLKAQIRAWAKLIHDDSGREPSAAECERNRPVLAEYRAVKQAIEMHLSSKNSVTSAGSEVSEIAMKLPSDSMVGSLSDLFSVSAEVSEAAAWLVSDNWLTAHLSALWDVTTRLDVYREAAGPPISVVSPIDDSSIPIWERRYRDVVSENTGMSNSTHSPISSDGHLAATALRASCGESTIPKPKFNPVLDCEHAAVDGEGKEESFIGEKKDEIELDISRQLKSQADLNGLGTASNMDGEVAQPFKNQPQHSASVSPETEKTSTTQKEGSLAKFDSQGDRADSGQDEEVGHASNHACAKAPPEDFFTENVDRAVRQFNLSAKKGVQFILAQEMASTPAEVADFLCNTKGLNKAQIGEYLGEPVEFNLQVLQILARMFPYQGNFISALRLFLARFRLPGEAQKIDRILEAFAEAFFQTVKNQGDGEGGNCSSPHFSSASTVHILAFSAIMLNTDAHNPSISKKQKMTLEQFVRNNRGIDDGKDLPLTILEDIFADITTNEILTQTERDDEGNLFSNPGMVGWMEKSPPGPTIMGTIWRARYFILSGGILYYFRQPQDLDPVGFIMINDVITVASTLLPDATQTPSRAAASVSIGAASADSRSPTAEFTVKAWATNEQELSGYLRSERDRARSRTSALRNRLSVFESGSSSDTLFPLQANPAARVACEGKHVTFTGAGVQKLGISLRSRGRCELPVLETSMVPTLDQNDVLVSIDGRRICDFPNPLSDAIALIRNRRGSITLTFISGILEAKVAQTLPSKPQASKQSQESAVKFFEDHERERRSAAYVSIVPTFGEKVKSAKYNSKGLLVPGSHNVVRLRVASMKIAEEWVTAINEVATHTLCLV